MKYITELVSFGLAVPLLLYAGLSPLLEGRPVHVPFLLLVYMYWDSKRAQEEG